MMGTVQEDLKELVEKTKEGNVKWRATNLDDEGNPCAWQTFSGGKVYVARRDRGGWVLVYDEKSIDVEEDGVPKEAVEAILDQA